MQKNGRKLFASEVGRDFAPLLGFPLQNTGGDATRFEPLFGTRNHVEQRSGALCLFERGFALLAAHPTDGSAAVAIDGDVFESLFLYQRESVNNGKKFANVVCAQHWTIVKNLLSCAEIDAAIFHRTGVFGTGCIDDYGGKSHLLHHIGRRHEDGTIFGRMWGEGGKRSVGFSESCF